MASNGEPSSNPAPFDEEEARVGDTPKRPDSKETHDVASDAPSETQTTTKTAYESRRFATWTLGEPFSDQAKVSAALDRLVRPSEGRQAIQRLYQGPFFLESDTCPLPLMDPRRGPFDESDETEEETRIAVATTTTTTETDVRGLQELQLNDVVEDASPLKTATDEESIEEISDRLLQERDVEEDAVRIDQHLSKRKRKEFVSRERCNFVKHNLKNKRRKMRNKPRATKKSRATAPPPPPKPVGQESIC